MRGGEEVKEEKRALFFEDERVEIRFEKLPGTLTFKRSIAALTVGHDHSPAHAQGSNKV